MARRKKKTNIVPDFSVSIPKFEPEIQEDPDIQEELETVETPISFSDAVTETVEPPEPPKPVSKWENFDVMTSSQEELGQYKQFLMDGKE